METTLTEATGAALGAEESVMTGMVMQQPVTMAQRKGMVAIDESKGSFYALVWALDYVGDGGVEEDRSVEDLGGAADSGTCPAAVPAGPGGTAFYATSTVIGEESTRRKRCPYLVSCTADVQGEDDESRDMICQATEQMHTDLLVVGSRGLGKIKRAFLGSVSDYCAHHAKCPILIVKSPKGTTTTST